MKKFFYLLLLAVVFISIGAVTTYRIRDIKGDTTGAPTLRQELTSRYVKSVVNDSLLNHYTKNQSNVKYFKVVDGVEGLPKASPAFSGTLFISTINTAPVTPTSTGTLGEIRFTTTGIYICTTTNVWIKCVGATW